MITVDGQRHPLRVVLVAVVALLLLGLVFAYNELALDNTPPPPPGTTQTP